MQSHTLIHIREFNGCGMGPLLVLVSPCFRENVVVTCKIGSFLCSLDNLLQKSVIVFFFENQISKWVLIWKKGKSYKKSFSTYLTYIHTCILLTQLPYPFWKKKKIRIYQVWFLFGVWFLVLILIRAILEQSINNKMVSKNCLLLICIDTYAKFIVICKPRTLNDGGEDSVKYRNRKTHCFLAAAILLIIGKIILTW